MSAQCMKRVSLNVEVVCLCFLPTPFCVPKAVAATAVCAAPISSLPMENSCVCTPRLMASYEAFRLDVRRPGT